MDDDAIVAGAAAAIQGVRKAQRLTPLGPMDMRRLLANTGTSHAGTRHIGPQPDLAAALADLAINPVTTYGACSLPATHSDECGGAACERRTSQMCWDECWFFGLFCEQECLVVLSEDYECVNR